MGSVPRWYTFRSHYWYIIPCPSTPLAVGEDLRRGMSPEQALDQPRFGSANFPVTGKEVNRSPASSWRIGSRPERPAP